eukprot:gb/GECG01003811.1/.p1 GENE.gb/GECG01003811.1/~~gb/GECG01003811.1/.p1  ORF type:complete len:392 (+),score=70.68 gb/GECG01003811.1/:1-1176(+)
MQGHPPPPPPPTSANTGADTGEVDASLPRVEDILTIDPTDRLLFESRLPDDDGTQWEATLMLRNTSGFHIAFKVKTTAPAKYIVRPNKGIIDPETTAHVRFVFQADSSEMPYNAEKNDRFMFECAVLKQETVDQLDSHGDRAGDTLNMILKKIPKSQMMKKKYDSRFELPAHQETATTENSERVNLEEERTTSEPEPSHSNPPQHVEYGAASYNVNEGTQQGDFHSRHSDREWAGYEGEPQPIYGYADYPQSGQEEPKQATDQTVEDLQEQLRQIRLAKVESEHQCQTLEHQKEDLYHQWESIRKEKEDLQRQVTETGTKLDQEERRRRKLHEKYDKLKEELHGLRDAKEELDVLKEAQAEQESGYQFSLFQVVLMAIVAFMAGRLLSILL